MWLILRGKTGFVNICPFYWFDQTNLFKQIQIFFRICSFSNLLRKTNSVYFCALFWDFWLKIEIFSELAKKCFKTTEKHSLAVCGSFCGKKEFLLIFDPFYGFEQNGLFSSNQNFLLDLPLSKIVWKTNYLSLSDLLSEIVTFLTKKNSFQWIVPKMLQNNRRAYFSCMWLTLREKKIFVYICPVLLLWTKRIVYNKSNFLLDLLLFKSVEKKNFLNISELLSEIVFFWIKNKLFQ